MAEAKRCFRSAADTQCCPDIIHCLFRWLWSSAKHDPIVLSSPSTYALKYLLAVRIILWAFQGIGGSGAYGIAVMSVYELVPPPALPKYVGIVSAVFAISYGSGPIIGGAIDQGATWRWIFLLKYNASTSHKSSFANNQ